MGTYTKYIQHASSIQKGSGLYSRTLSWFKEKLEWKTDFWESRIKYLVPFTSLLMAGQNRHCLDVIFEMHTFLFPKVKPIYGQQSLYINFLTPLKFHFKKAECLLRQIILCRDVTQKVRVYVCV
jgi:hypothetical protein